MSHSGHSGSTDHEHGPSQIQKTLASLAAGLVIAAGRIVYSIFKFIFSILSALA